MVTCFSLNYNLQLSCRQPDRTSLLLFCLPPLILLLLGFNCSWFPKPHITVTSFHNNQTNVFRRGSKRLFLLLVV